MRYASCASWYGHVVSCVHVMSCHVMGLFAPLLLFFPPPKGFVVSLADKGLRTNNRQTDILDFFPG